MKNLAAIILAAGKGTRMKSSMPKVMHRVAGKPMLWHPLEVLKGLKVGKVVVVVGHGKDAVEEELSGQRGLEFIHQEEQKGTGHAVMCALKALRGFKGDVLILSGDVPLITRSTIKGLRAVHGRGGSKAALSLVTAVLDNPAGYGRVVRDEDNSVVGIVEDKDCGRAEKKIKEVNTGIYLADAGFLAKNIKRLGNANAQGEYYLPDLIGMAAREGKKVKGLTHAEPGEVMGVNNRVELARAEAAMRKRVLEALMLSGVTVVDPQATYVDSGVKVGRDTVIHPGVHLKGETTVGAGCVLEEGASIRDSSIGKHTAVKSYSVIEDARIGNCIQLGPFARLRPGNTVKDGARLGNFVEVKNSTIGKNSKANHLTYIGDTTVGEGVNIGAGTITCNYDGVRKHRTVIGDGAFVGSDTQLVAPVRLGKNAYVGSGTTVTKDVPAWALVTARAQERVVRDWVKRKGLKEKKKKK